MIRTISPAEAKRLLDEENGLLVDIRESDEFAGEYIEGARLEPLSVLPFLAFDPDRARPAIFYCHSGRRAKDNAAILEKRGFTATYLMQDGLEGWKKAGLPTIRLRGPLPMPRQIQMVAGSLVFLFSLLSLFFTPAFTWLTLFIGASLVFAGYTGICLMARLLMRMPWNRQRRRPL